MNRSAVIWGVLAVLIGAYAFWLSSQLDEARVQTTAAQERGQQLVQQLHQLATMSSQRNTPAVDARTERLMIALLRRPDLIPFEPVMGGTFYFLEQSLQVLSDRHLLVAAEDGHIRGQILMGYSTAADDTVSFRIIEAALD